jgi:PAS domain S-box-containing protein
MQSDELFADGGDAGALMRAIDWSLSPLGPVAAWPKSLRTCVRIILTSRQPMFIWWGDQLINLYNDAYRAIVGGKHPAALGQPASVVWSEIWDQVGPRAYSTLHTNRGTYDEALLLIMERHGYQEETYYTFSYSPVPNDDGSIGGIICANTDETPRIVDERRLALMRDLASSTAHARTWQQSCLASASALAKEARDIPFALIYVVEDDHRSARLASATGFPERHPMAPVSIILEGATPWRVKEAVQSREVQLIDCGAGQRLPTGAWPQPPRCAAAVPILASGDTGRAGVLVVGLNPFRPFDAKYRDFLLLIAGQISAGMANANAYEEERKRTEALTELDRAKTVFFSNVSHEFRTPLTLMLAPIEDSLADGDEPLPPHQRERQLIVHRNAQRLLKLVNSLLDFSRIEAGRMSATYAAVDLSALTLDVASTFRSTIERGGLRFLVECPPLGQEIHVDRDMWEKIVLNLLSNAFKHTFTGSITVTLQLVDEQVELSVADTGIGIASDQLPRLFERFHRVQGVRSRTHEGTGIGLALVQELAKLHGGSIRVRSEIDRGSTFTVSIRCGTGHLPREQVQDVRIAERPSSQSHPFVAEAGRWLPSPQRALPPPGQPAVHPHGGRILLADDNGDMREYLQRLLSRHWQVDTVADGAEALASARTHPPDLILSDVMMPALDGFALVRELRQDERTRQLPVILLSARAGEEAYIEGLSTGADDYLTKPFSAQELIARVRTHIQLKRQRELAAQGIREKEQLLRLVTDQARIGLIMIDRQYRYLFANPTYGSFINRPSADLVGLHMLDVLGPLFDREIRQRLERAFAGERVDFEIRFRPGEFGSQERIFASSYTPSFDPDSEPCIVAVIVDITERKGIEESLRYRTEQYATLLNQAPIGVYVLDSQLRFRDLNPVARPAFAAAGDDIIGRSFPEVIFAIRPNPYAQELVDIFRHTLETGEPYEMPESIHYAGALVQHEWRADRITLPDGSFGVVCYFRDITRQIAARNAVARHAEDLHRANIELEHFASIASHDLQEPLRMISSYADILLRKYGPLFDERGRKYFNQITAGIERMRSLIHAILSYSQVGRRDAVMAPVDLNRIVTETLENLQEQITLKSAQVEIGELPSVIGDAARFSQLFQNLISNAIKFSRPGRSPIVTIEGAEAGDYCSLRISDNGIGIPSGSETRIFQIFQRLHSDKDYQGSGIGLATCKKIVEQHGGRIGVESRPGLGSTFHFTLAKRPAGKEVP